MKIIDYTILLLVGITLAHKKLKITFIYEYYYYEYINIPNIMKSAL